MTIKFLLIQLLGLIPSAIAITSLQSDNRKRILVLQVLCNIMWGAQYIILGAFTGLATDIIGLFRAGLCYFNDKKWAKSKVWLWVLLLSYAFSAVITWDGFVSVLPCFSMMLTTIALWTHDMRKTRLLFLFNSPPIFLYNLLVKSYSCAAIEVIAFISFIIAIYRFDVRPAQKEKMELCNIDKNEVENL